MARATCPFCGEETVLTIPPEIGQHVCTPKPKPVVPDLVSAEQLAEELYKAYYGGYIDTTLCSFDLIPERPRQDWLRVARAALSRWPQPCENCADLQARNDHLIQMYADLSNSIRPNDPVPQTLRKENE